MAVSWTEHCEKVSAKEYSDDISDIASTINEVSQLRDHGI